MFIRGNNKQVSMNHRLSITVKIYTQNTDFTVFTRIPDADKVIKKSVGEDKRRKIKIFLIM